MDDVSCNEQRIKSTGNSTKSKNLEPNDKNSVFLESLQCDKLNERSKNVLILKQCLHHSCERNNYLSVNGVTNDNNKSSILGGRTRSHDGRPSNKLLEQQNVCNKRSNLCDRWLSTQSLQGNSSGNINCVSLRRRIVCSLVLLEAFGNASDPGNSNSSRFVSIMKAQSNTIK